MFMFGMTGMAHDATVEYNEDEAGCIMQRSATTDNKTKARRRKKQEREKNTRDDDDDDDDDDDSKDASSLRRRRRLVVDAARRARKTTTQSSVIRTWFRALFHFDEAHPTVPGDGQARVVAKPRDVHAGVFARLQNRHAFMRALLARPRTPELSLLLLLKVLLLRSRTSTTTTTTTMPRAILSCSSIPNDAGFDRREDDRPPPPKRDGDDDDDDAKTRAIARRIILRIQEEGLEDNPTKLEKNIASLLNRGPKKRGGSKEPSSIVGLIRV